MCAHHETIEWGRTSIAEDRTVRVLIRELGARRYANYLVPAEGLEHMEEADWPAWLEENSLAEFFTTPALAAHCFWDLPHAQPAWEVSTLIRDGETTPASCLVPTRSFWQFMAWDGPGCGEPIVWAEATVPMKDIAAAGRGKLRWESRGDDLMARICACLLHRSYYDADETSMQVAADPSGGFTIAIQWGGKEDIDPVPELRRLIAHLYEWSEHCQGVAWTALSLRLKQAASAVDVELHLGYDAE
jgi:hypothetical protein